MKKIILGLILFLLVAFLPLGYNIYTGKKAYIPVIKAPEDKKECVENVFIMRKRHNIVLEKWRDASVRHGIKKYVSLNGTYKISLTGTCLGCHSDKTQFCDRCHDYAGVKPRCWDCHNIPDKVAEK
ncbi:MAG TPA: sulfate reduction electron transfer complex DsrMKJOP subunit DsrJ [Syntrophorhabdaceae bacterium]|nr:sulfate reduction electron transfer complex DsrMKJOP subunit DsrJ [Syntrophorhabdaceae bacterium]